MGYGPQYEPGRYYVRATGQSLSESSTGNPQFVLNILVLGKIDPANPDGDLLSCDSRDRTIYQSITDGTIKFVAENLERLGFSGSSFAQLDPNVNNYHDFSGTEFVAYCEHDTYKGNVKEKWGIAKGASEMKPLEASKLRQLDAMFGKHLKRTATAASTTDERLPRNPNGTIQGANKRPTAKQVADDPNLELQASTSDDVPF